MVQSRLRYLLIIISLTIVLPSWAQRRGYIVKDTTYIQGYLNYAADAQKGEPVNFWINRNATFTTYYPKDLEEYGFKKGNTYLSKLVGGQHQFMLRLATGNVTLYSSKYDGTHQFYLEKQGELIALNKKGNFRNQLKYELADCPYISDASKLIFYNKKSLPRIVNYYNNCSESYFPFTRFGLTMGISSRKLNLQHRAFEPSFRNNSGIATGAFIDFPNDVFSKWSTRFELLYKSHKYSLHEQNPYVVRDYSIELSTITVPILLRYRHYNSSWWPFFNFGAVLGFNLKTDVNLIETTNDPDGTVTKEFDLNIIDKQDLGGALGVGLEYQLDYKRTAGFEIRYQFSFGIGGRIDHTLTDLQLLASMSF